MLSSWKWKFICSDESNRITCFVTGIQLFWDQSYMKSDEFRKKMCNLASCVKCKQVDAGEKVMSNRNLFETRTHAHFSFHSFASHSFTSPAIHPNVIQLTNENKTRAKDMSLKVFPVLEFDSIFLRRSVGFYAVRWEAPLHWVPESNFEITFFVVDLFKWNLLWLWPQWNLTKLSINMMCLLHW